MSFGLLGSRTAKLSVQNCDRFYKWSLKWNKYMWNKLCPGSMRIYAKTGRTKVHCKGLSNALSNPVGVPPSGCNGSSAHFCSRRCFLCVAAFLPRTFWPRRGAFAAWREIRPLCNCALKVAQNLPPDAEVAAACHGIHGCPHLYIRTGNWGQPAQLGCTKPISSRRASSESLPKIAKRHNIDDHPCHGSLRDKGLLFKCGTAA